MSRPQASSKNRSHSPSLPPSLPLIIIPIYKQKTTCSLHHHGVARSLTPQPQLLLSHHHHNHHPPPPLHFNPIITRRSLVLSTTSLSLTTTTPPPPSLASPPLDTTITDRIFMDFSLYPTTFLPNTNPTLSPDPSTPFCTKSFLLGRIILGLYGHLVPLTVSNFSLCVPLLPLPHTRTPKSTKSFH